MQLKRLNINDICNRIWAKASMCTNILTRQSIDNDGNQAIHEYVQFLINHLSKSIEIFAGQVAYLIWSFGKLSKFYHQAINTLKLSHNYVI